MSGSPGEQVGIPQTDSRVSIRALTFWKPCRTLITSWSRNQGQRSWGS